MVIPGEFLPETESSGYFSSLLRHVSVIPIRFRGGIGDSAAKVIVLIPQGGGVVLEDRDTFCLANNGSACFVSHR